MVLRRVCHTHRCAFVLINCDAAGKMQEDESELLLTWAANAVSCTRRERNSQTRPWLQRKNWKSSAMEWITCAELLLCVWYLMCASRWQTERCCSLFLHLQIIIVYWCCTFSHFLNNLDFWEFSKRFPCIVSVHII